MWKLALLEMVMMSITFFYCKMNRYSTPLALLAGVVWLPYWLLRAWKAYERGIR